MEELLIKEKNAAKVLGVSYAWLKAYRLSGKIRFVRVGGRNIRYRKSDLLAWIEKNQVEVKSSV